MLVIGVGAGRAAGLALLFFEPVDFARFDLRRRWSAGGGEPVS
ncbi:hypothetical protein ACFL5Q_07620 [Planctomycetota bacterium]